MLPVLKKLAFLYNPYVLCIVTLGYVVAELGHFLIGVTSKATAKDLDYGDHSCQLNATAGFGHGDIPIPCDTANTTEACAELILNGTAYCEWDYNGLGLDYQVLAGPSFIAVYTVVGVILGICADRYNRVFLLSICTTVFSIAIILMGAVNEYWQLVILRMVLAAGEAGCNPMSAGILSDIFSAEYRALALSIFNWGIYGGYGVAFPIGRYVPKLDAWGLGWRVTYYGGGIVGLLIAFLTAFTLREPERQNIGEEEVKQKEAQANNANGNIVNTAAEQKKEDESAWKVLLQPRIILLCLAASIRHTGGLCFAYNCDLYYLMYYPEYDLGWWLFAVTIVIGSIGVVVGGVVSDKFVEKMGIRSRVAILALSQLIATPLAFGSVYCDPVGAMVTLGISYFFAEMWFGILFAILVEVVPLSVRSTAVGVFLFIMNNIGGNLPILVEPVSKAIGYRESLWIFYVGAYLLSSVMFLFTMFLMEPPAPKPKHDLEHAAYDNSLATIEQINGHRQHVPIETLEISRL
ncbi:putative metabolite transport protein HI_1104 [Ischnura elegans]|uniref:putative metabolite transport protein HI_1104 n=1 Tax=Ischnura elegans TaxID=197161 RepID=UPI001ED88608|nr:putative metabolite transport protein HI_1104 [Ischnura elegans]XP_046385580.1 putative metabolite transport protein HI_1104 [Ischnura elegans]